MHGGKEVVHVTVASTRGAFIEGKEHEDMRVVRPLEEYGDFREDGLLESCEPLDHDTSLQKLIKAAGLVRIEVIVLILYTGPMFLIYNGILRGFGACGEVQAEIEFGSDKFWTQFNSVKVSERMKQAGHKFSATMHVLASAIKKMQRTSRASGFVQGTQVFRGLSGLDVAEFLASIGFCEKAFMSTTKSLKVAIDYSGVKQGKIATVLAMEVSEVDQVAVIAPFSQYPGEEEGVWNSCSYLEPRTGEDELIMTKWGAVRVVHVKTSANSKAMTLKELEDRRKTIVTTMLDSQLHDIYRELEVVDRDEQVKARAQTDMFCGSWMTTQGHSGVDPSKFTEENSLWNSGVIKSITDASEGFVREMKGRDASWFNNDLQYRRAVEESVDLKRLAMRKVTCWISASNAFDTKNQSLQTCDRVATGATWRLLQTSEDSETVKSLALQICKDHAFVVDTANDVVNDSTKETALMRQAGNGSTSSCLLLVKAGADPNAADTSGGTAVTYATQAGQTETAIALIKECGAASNLRQEDTAVGGFPLVIAATSGHDDLVMALVKECGANPNIFDTGGFTGAHRAALKPYASTIETLIQCGADINLCCDHRAGGSRGKTVLDIIWEHKDIELAKRLRDKHGATAALHDVNA